MNKIELVIDNSTEQLILCGGPYSNFSSLEALVKKYQKVKYKFCLGDIGGFGPHPDRSIKLLQEHQFYCIKGNYDQTVGEGEADCGCGYIDANDRKFAQISFDYTLKNTSLENRSWLRSLPDQMLIKWQGKKILLCHGSPDEVNEFVFDSETSDDKIDYWLQKEQVDFICVTHSGLPWMRKTKNGMWINVGVIGRPAHEGLKNVFYAKASVINQQIEFSLNRLDYDPTAVIEEMRKENLPEEFCESLITGEWTTCSNILPEAEKEIRRRT